MAKGGSGSSGWEKVNAKRGADGRSKWTKADWESYLGGPSPASKRSGRTPKQYDDVVPF